MKDNLKHAMKVASTVRRQLMRARHNDLDRVAERRAHLAQRMQRLVGMAELLTRAARARYSGAARRLQQRYDYQLSELLNEIHHHHASRDQDGRPDHPLPTPRQIFEELNQLEAEFGVWNLERTSQSLSVETDSVVLEGITLGRFRISLELNRIAEGVTAHPLLIEALDPNPAAGSDHVTHPHVSDQRLCMGEATTTISSALRDGRLTDVYLLIRNVLTTYNPDSPYVSLDDWDGDPCPECGDRMSGENRFWCEVCDRDYCDQCMGTCQDCNNTTCYGCLSTCDHCEETYCSSCMRQCADCGESCCPGCLEDDQCPTCLEAKEPNNDNEAQETTPQPPEIETQEQQPTSAQATEPAAA